jgi:protein AbiQ
VSFSWLGNKKVISECFATQNASLTTRVSGCLPLLGLWRVSMDNLKIYEVKNEYIDYLLPYAPHLFKNKKKGQNNERKYIGVVLEINGMKYFAPLSSFKEKHKKMKDGLDFLKVKNYAVININNMFPVPDSEYIYIDIDKEKDIRYKSLLRAEYRFIKSIQEKIRKNAVLVYNHKLKNGSTTPLSKRCNDFVILEAACKKYK